MNDQGDGGKYRAAGNLGALGMVMGLCVAIGVVGGLWLDKKLGTSPVLTIVGLLLGAAAAFYEVLRAVRMSRTDDR